MDVNKCSPGFRKAFGLISVLVCLWKLAIRIHFSPENMSSRGMSIKYLIQVIFHLTFLILDSSFTRNFRIPKRSSDQAFGYETPLNNDDNDYKGYSVQRRWQQGATFTQYPTPFTPVQYPTPISNPITQNIWNTLSNIKERPKNHQRNISKS